MEAMTSRGTLGLPDGDNMARPRAAPDTEDDDMHRIRWAAAAATLLLAGAALAATPAQNCRSNKNKEAGKYAGCRQKAEAKFLQTGDYGVRAAALARCAESFAVRWPQIEDQAGGTCPSTGDEIAIQQYLDTATGNVAAALLGEMLAGQAQPVKTGQTQCWDSAGQLVSCAGTGLDGESQYGLERAYVDNGDGTITDARTGLMWEKLSRDGGIHDKENVYGWPQAFSVKIAGLNALQFAGYSDWRLPNVNELYSLVESDPYSPAVSSPAFHWNCIVGCTVLSCSCTYTQSASYWTSTSDPAFGGRAAWTVFFHDGSVSRRSNLDGPRHVRAVRGGF